MSTMYESQFQGQNQRGSCVRITKMLVKLVSRRQMIKKEQNEKAVDSKPIILDEADRVHKIFKLRKSRRVSSFNKTKHIKKLGIVLSKSSLRVSFNLSKIVFIR